MNQNLNLETTITILIYLMLMIDFVMIQMGVLETANQEEIKNQEKTKNQENKEKPEKINYKISVLPEYLFYAKVIFTIISVFSDTS